MLRSFLAALVVLAIAAPAEAQWTNRYPAVPGYSHHVYLEGYDLPTASAGITDPAPSPDGRAVAFASKGWLWVLDLETGRAERVTSGAEVDARPAWSPDGRAVAFVRDDGRETWIVALDLGTGAEQIVSREPGIELDPAWTPDGRAVVFAAATPTGIGLARVELATGARTVVTDDHGVAVAPTALADGRLLYLAKYGTNEVRLRDPETGVEDVLYSGRIQSQTRPALSPDGQTLALTVPHDDGWELVLADVDAPDPTLRLTASRAAQLGPAWSADGETLYFAQADADEHLRLMEMPSVGGTPREIEIRDWDWGVELGTLTVRTRIGDASAPARLALRDAAGHPLFPDVQTWFDGENGTVFAYSPGEIVVEVPVGAVSIAAVQGPATPVATAEVDVEVGSTSVTLALRPVWDARANGWLSGDLHFHLNYGGPYALALSDLAPVMRGENLDVGTPLLANLHNRYEDDELWGAPVASSTPFLAFGQEIRSHFFGHVSLVGTETLFEPWIWGPGYQVFADDDRENATAIAHARAEGGFGTYVHPVGVRDPFAAGNEGTVPIEMVADGVLGDLDAIEVVCLWTDDLGTSEVWYRLLNLGRAVVPSAGSDVMANFYRTMAPGTARAYVQTGSDVSYAAFLDGLKAGRSFVTTAPLLDARVGGEAPGGVVEAGAVEWSADLYSAVPVERIELIVNGEVVATESGLSAPGRRSVRGTVELPAGGWVAVRAVGEAAGWPSMAAYSFAHTAPVWIGAVGSTDAAAERQAARDLLRVLDVSEAQFERAYADEAAPLLRNRFSRARAELVRRAGQ